MRQFQIAALLSLGYTRVEIGELLGVQATTIRTHVHVACHKLGVNTAAALASEVAVRWLRTPRSGRQHYVDEFDRRLTLVLARRDARERRDRRNPRHPELDDLIKLILMNEDY